MRNRRTERIGTGRRRANPIEMMIEIGRVIRMRKPDPIRRRTDGGTRMKIENITRARIEIPADRKIVNHIKRSIESHIEKRTENSINQKTVAKDLTKMRLNLQEKSNEISRSIRSTPEAAALPHRNEKTDDVHLALEPVDVQKAAQTKRRTLASPLKATPTRRMNAKSIKSPPVESQENTQKSRRANHGGQTEIPAQRARTAEIEMTTIVAVTPASTKRKRRRASTPGHDPARDPGVEADS